MSNQEPTLESLTEIIEELELRAQHMQEILTGEHKPYPIEEEKDEDSINPMVK